jgi:L-threonylcarbamoyladenylate synthase
MSKAERWSFSGSPSADQRDAIAAVLQRSGVALLPTDTIYGLHAVATDERAVARLTRIKGRADDKPFVVLGASIDQLAALGVAFDDDMRAALSEIWPAPLTAILPLRAPIPASRGAASLAVRIPALEWLRELVEATGALASSSANHSGMQAITSVAELPPRIESAIDAIVDGGPLGGTPSSIVNLTGVSPQWVREGDTTFSQKVWKTLRKSL